MSGYDSKHVIEKNWTYRELLEMIYLEELKAIQQYKYSKKQEEKDELERMVQGF